MQTPQEIFAHYAEIYRPFPIETVDSLRQQICKELDTEDLIMALFVNAAEYKKVLSTFRNYKVTAITQKDEIGAINKFRFLVKDELKERLKDA